MGGEIKVDSALGKGSCFVVTLPMKPPVSAIVVQHPVAMSHAIGEGRSLKVLLAEDQPIGRMYATRLLERMGHQVVAVEDGKQAVAAWQSSPFDLILMDVQMPVMDGIVATSEIRSNEVASGAHIPIIALTAHALTGDGSKLLELGFDGYVAKPIDVDLLIGEVGRLMNENGGGV